MRGRFDAARWLAVSGMLATAGCSGSPVDFGARDGGGGGATYGAGGDGATGGTGGEATLPADCVVPTPRTCEPGEVPEFYYYIPSERVCAFSDQFGRGEDAGRFGTFTACASHCGVKVDPRAAERTVITDEQSPCPTVGGTGRLWGTTPFGMLSLGHATLYGLDGLVSSLEIQFSPEPPYRAGDFPKGRLGLPRIVEPAETHHVTLELRSPDFGRLSLPATVQTEAELGPDGETISVRGTVEVETGDAMLYGEFDLADRCGYITAF